MIGALLQYFCLFTASGEVAKEPAGKMTPGNHSVSIMVNDLERHYVVHVPHGDTFGKRYPVVIVFHGGGGKALGVMWETGWANKADVEGFLAVFPEGTPPDPSKSGHFVRNPQTWNDGSGRRIVAVNQAVADIEFVLTMIGDLNQRFKINEDRVYATGFSNGASMSFRVARELSNTVAAIAPVAGSDWLVDKQPDRVVPLLYITGTDDPLNPLEGGVIYIGGKSFGIKPSVKEMINRWVQLYGLTAESRVVYENDGTKGVSYRSKFGIDTVVFFTIEGHGHHWPGGRSALPEWISGNNTAKFNATDIIWDFFKKHSLSVNKGTVAQH